MASIVICILLAAILLGVLRWMVQNVRRGKSFCGADYGAKKSSRK